MHGDWGAGDRYNRIGAEILYSDPRPLPPEEALDGGTVGAAGLDVFWEEAAPQPAWLAGRENVVLTPHLGGSTCECDGGLVEAVIRALRD